MSPYKCITNIKIKPFSIEYRDNLVDVIFDAYSRYPEYGETSPKRAKKYLNWLKNHSTMFDVMFVDNETAGFIVVDTNWIRITFAFNPPRFSEEIQKWSFTL